MCRRKASTFRPRFVLLGGVVSCGTAARGSLLASYVAPTLARAGFDARLVLDLDEFFRAG
jgi:hypothetical protein